MELKKTAVSDLRPAEYNPRRRTEHVLKTVRESIKDYGFIQPVVVNSHECPGCGNRKGIIIGGHRRLDAAKAEGMTEVEVVELNLHLTDEKKANLRFNAQEEFKKGELANLIAEMHALDANEAQTLGFSAEDITRMLFENRYNDGTGLGSILQEKFLIPPFSVLDAKQGYWQDRKKLWRAAMGNIGESREGVLAGSNDNLLMRGINYGSSFFDPVLAEIMFSWFAPDTGSVILDPFVGEQTKAFVASALGYQYHGIEIRPEQNEVNRKALEASGLKANFYDGDSQNLNQLVPADLKADLVFTSPPYYDLEIYSDGVEDLSAKQTYGQFLEGYKKIFAQAVEHLKDNRFVVIKVGDIRDERGMYRDFVSDNIRIMRELGLGLYNEIIYSQMLATAPHRAERNMRSRKVVKTHQNILTFYKGDPSLLRNPQLLEVHAKILVFLKGEPEAIKDGFKQPPPIQHNLATFGHAENPDQSQTDQGASD